MRNKSTTATKNNRTTTAMMKSMTVEKNLTTSAPKRNHKNLNEASCLVQSSKRISMKNNSLEVFKHFFVSPKTQLNSIFIRFHSTKLQRNVLSRFFFELRLLMNFLRPRTSQLSTASFFSWGFPVTQQSWYNLRDNFPQFKMPHDQQRFSCLFNKAKAKPS